MNRFLSATAMAIFALVPMGAMGVSEPEESATDAAGRDAMGNAASMASSRKDEAVVQAPAFTLEDQFGDAHTYSYPRSRIAVLVLADKAGSKQVEGWVVPLYDRYGDRVDIDGVAELQAVPEALRGIVRFFFRRNSDRPIMMDWEGSVTDALKPIPRVANVYVVDHGGAIVIKASGEAAPESLAPVISSVDEFLDRTDVGSASAGTPE